MENDYSKCKITLDGALLKKLHISITLKRRREKKHKSQKKVLFNKINQLFQVNSSQFEIHSRAILNQNIGTIIIWPRKEANLQF